MKSITYSERDKFINVIIFYFLMCSPFFVLIWMGFTEFTNIVLFATLFLFFYLIIIYGGVSTMNKIMTSEDKIKYLKAICKKSSVYNHFEIKLTQKEYKDIFGAQQ